MNVYEITTLKSSLEKCYITVEHYYCTNLFIMI